MNEGERHSKRIGNGCCSFRTARVRADHDCTLVIRDLLTNEVLKERPAIQIIDWDIEKALVLSIMEVHGDDVFRSGAGEEIGNKSPGLSDPLLIAWSGLELCSTLRNKVARGGSIDSFCRVFCVATLTSSIRECASILRSVIVIEMDLRQTRLEINTIGKVLGGCVGRLRRLRGGVGRIWKVWLVVDIRCFRKWCAGLVVRNVALSRVWEKW